MMVGKAWILMRIWILTSIRVKKLALDPHWSQCGSKAQLNGVSKSSQIHYTERVDKNIR
jgi:hypothetical protein